MNKALLFGVAVLAFLAYFFSGVGFGFDALSRIAAGIIAFALLYFAAQRSAALFFLVSLSALSSAAALGCAFLNITQPSGPLALGETLSPWTIIVLSSGVGLLAWFWHEKSKSKDRFAAILLFVFALNWIILAFNVRYYDDWKMENWLTVPFVIIIYFTHRWFRLSNVSYGLIFTYMMLHIYGSHYTYAEVPFGFWMQGFFDLARNHYDRVVHFAFGFLLAYPLREMTIRISNTKGFWGFWFPIEFVLAFSCIYELLEWLIVILFGGDLGVAYLGTQGDVWDAQKDMLNAGLGAALAIAIILIIVWYYRGHDFWREFRESLRVKHKKALGEEALRQIGK